MANWGGGGEEENALWVAIARLANQNLCDFWLIEHAAWVN